MYQRKELSIFKQLLLLFGLMLGGLLLNFLLGFLGLLPLGGMAGYSNALANPEDNIASLKFLQIIQAFCLFVLPAYFFARITHTKPLHFLGLKRGINLKATLVIILSTWAVIPLINLLGFANTKLVLPQALSGIENWMIAAEERAAFLTELLTSGTSVGTLIINLIMIAILPAIGEELIFRGIIQRAIQNKTRNIHVAIWLSAFIFSAFHLQFFGFLPRFFLGAMLGYLYVYSGSLWMPILAHFVNNATATVFFFLHNKGIVGDELDTIGTGETWTYGILSAGILLIICFYMERNKTELQLDELSK